MTYRLIFGEGDSDMETERFSEPNKDEVISLLVWYLRRLEYSVRVIYPGSDEWI